MKAGNSILIGLVIAVVAGLPGLAYCQTGGTALLIQPSPANGGEIYPGVGVHRFDLNTYVTLTAAPNPGYRFVYWIGDVSDVETSSTIVHLDSPKVVIAVFERVEYEFLTRIEGATSAPAQGLIGSPPDYFRRGGGGAIRGRRFPPSPPPLPPPPSPPESDAFPVPIPEPATGILLVLGGLFAFAKGRLKKQV